MWTHKRAENLCAAMLATMFMAFMIQIVFRYALNLPTGWTNELSAALWIWIVLFGSAFVVREDQEIRFDVLYSGVSNRTRRLFNVITAISLVFLFSYSLPAVIDYVTFMKVQKTAYMKVRFDYLYAIYIIFAVAMIVRYVWLGFRAVYSKDVPGFDHHDSGSIE
jgi:TRAP-type C4-dicarboxylate transport system permease small subunit